jgi:hypothetical protein
MVGPSCDFSILLIKIKLKGNFIFLRVLTEKINGESKLTVIESSVVQIERF